MIKKAFRLLLFGSLFLLQIGSSCKRNNDVLEETIDTPSLPTQPTQWIMSEIEFKSKKTYSDNFKDVDIDVIFTHSNGTEIRMPAFWDGKNTWKVRFTPTLPGEWSYISVCTDESNFELHNK